MILLDEHADTFPVGLAGTPFEEVYRALRTVAAMAWSVDPIAYRAGMAWGWYALHAPSALFGFREVVTAALISAVAPMVKASQTDAELVEYLRQWRSYTPTFPKLQALYALFGAVVDIQPISDPESQSVLPVDDTRLAFYVRIESVDFSRPLTLSEAREIAVRATPLGSRPYPYYALETRMSCTVSPAPVGVYIRLENWETARQPAPTLPTVSYIGRLIYSGGGLSAGEIGTLRDSNNNTITYNTDVSYAVYWYASSNWGYGDVSYVSLVNESGILKVKNISSTYISIYFVSTYECSSNQATVVTVYDSSNNPFNAFKYTASGTDYYYVLDGTQTDWTDDLSSIGYSLTPVIVLPTVSDLDWFSFSGAVQQLITIYPGAGSAIAIYVWGSSTTKPYDLSCSYAVSQWNSSSGVKGGATELSIINYNSSGGILGARNDTQNELSVWSVHVYSCSSNQATVVTVYDSSNVAYNAFKFIENNTDYYYVLDGTQTDWTDDLSSIGYRLPVIGYFSSSGESATRNTQVSSSYWYALYNAIGGYMEGDQSKTYTPIRAVTASGGFLDVSNGYMQCVLYTGLMNIQFKPAHTILARYLIFIES